MTMSFYDFNRDGFDIKTLPIFNVNIFNIFHFLFSNFETNRHNSSHRLKPIKLTSQDTNVKDRDYMTFMPGDYNYLDPNYMPAS